MSHVLPCLTVAPDWLLIRLADELLKEINDYDLRTDEEKIAVAEAIWALEASNNDAHKAYDNALPHIDEVNAQLKNNVRDLQALYDVQDMCTESMTSLEQVAQKFETLLSIHLEQNKSPTCIDHTRKGMADLQAVLNRIEELVQNYGAAIATAEDVPGQNPRKKWAERVQTATKAKPRKEERDVFMQTPLDDLFPGQWTPMRDFGGGMSRAGLWVKTDNLGRIIDVSASASVQDATRSLLTCVSSQAHRQERSMALRVRMAFRRDLGRRPSQL